MEYITHFVAFMAGMFVAGVIFSWIIHEMDKAGREE